MKGQTKTEFVYELSVSNQKKKEAEITLLDQVPISQDKSIVIERNESSKGQYNEDTGELRFEFVLNPGETKTFTNAYSVAWPKDKTVNL